MKQKKQQIVTMLDKHNFGIDSKGNTHKKPLQAVSSRIDKGVFPSSSKPKTKLRQIKVNKSGRNIRNEVNGRINRGIFPSGSKKKFKPRRI